VARLAQPEPLYVVTMRDVTAEQREHQDVKHAYLVISRILAISDDAIVNVDAERNITFFNRKAETLFGYLAEDVLGRPLDALLPQRHRTTHRAHIDAFERGKQPSRLMGERGEIIGLSRSGEEIPLEASITKVSIDGVPTFSAHLRDIRARKAAERELIESRERFRTVFDHAMEAIALLDPEGRVLELNGSTRALLGANVRAEGQLFWDLPWWPRRSERERLQARADAQRRVQLAAGGEQIRLRAKLIAATGETCTIDFSLRPVRTDGRTLAIVAEGRDITALVDGG
jgi:PAS domain S-box-containing protein